MPIAQHHLILRAAILSLLGLLIGVQYSKAIERNASSHIAQSLRLAYLSSPIEALLMLSVAALMALVLVCCL